MKNVSISGIFLFLIATALIIRNVSVGVDFFSTTNSLAIIGLILSISVIYKERKKNKS